MKNIIKATVIVALFIILVGSVGAYDQNHITMLQLVVQSGLCILGTWLLMKGWYKK